MPVYIILPLTALATAILSGMLGMGGGALLLAAMLCFLSHGEAIPAHGAIQLIANSTRTLAFLGHVDWKTVGRFVIGVVPGGALGVVLLITLGRLEHSEPYLKTLVGAYILLSLAIPKPAKGNQNAGSWWDFPLLGLAAGTAAFTVGAVGPLLAPLFARRGFTKERLVATKAICQSLLHLAKVPVFLVLRSYEDLTGLGTLTLIMALLVIPGTLIGKRFLKHLSERVFIMLFKLALLAAGLKIMLFDGLLKM